MIDQVKSVLIGSLFYSLPTLLLLAVAIDSRGRTNLQTDNMIRKLNVQTINSSPAHDRTRSESLSQVTQNNTSKNDATSVNKSNGAQTAQKILSPKKLHDQRPRSSIKSGEKSTKRAATELPKMLYTPGVLMRREGYNLNKPTLQKNIPASLSESSADSSSRLTTFSKLPKSGATYSAGFIVPNPKNPEFPKITKGTVTWSYNKGDDSSSGNPLIAANIQIKKLGLNVDVVFETKVGADRIIISKILIEVKEGYTTKIRGPIEIASLSLRANGANSGKPLPGNFQTLVDNKFEFILSRQQSDIYRLLKDLSEGRWFDIPIKLKDNRTAILTFERSKFGEQALLLAVSGR